MKTLPYDRNVWDVSYPEPVNTVQVFVTNRCDRRCRGCFYDRRLGSEDLDLGVYQQMIDDNGRDAEKIILLGGEPSLHPQLGEMVAYNESRGLRTTVYTNGVGVEALNDIYDSHPSLTIRVGVLGLAGSEKPLMGVVPPKNGFVVYMIRKDNILDVAPAAHYAKQALGVDDFMISTIRDIATTKSFWLDTEETMSMEEYAVFAQSVANILGLSDEYPQRLHISRRGIFSGGSEQLTCRFLNLFPDGSKIICPLDISLDVRETGPYVLGTRACNKCRGGGCLLQKLVLERR